MDRLTTATFLALLTMASTDVLKQSRATSCQPNENASQLIAFLDFVSGIVKEAKEKGENCGNGTKSETVRPMDCADLKAAGKGSGVYKIWPHNRVVSGPVDVLCDMDDDGGGWTVIQRRGDFNSSKDYFFRDWLNYKRGFGDLDKDFWIGNDVIFALTNQRACSIKFVLTDWDRNSAYASYDEFWIDDELHNYTVHVQGYRGDAGDSFTEHSGMAFSTKDRKNDNHNNDCAIEFKGAWWYNKCHVSNLNGMYLRGHHNSFADGVNWKAFKDYHYSLKDTFMKIRPKRLD